MTFPRVRSGRRCWSIKCRSAFAARSAGAQAVIVRAAKPQTNSGVLAYQYTNIAK